MITQSLRTSVRFTATRAFASAPSNTSKLATKGKKRNPRPKRVHRVHRNTTIVLTDGRTVLSKGPRPVSKIELQEDPTTHPFWTSGIAKQFHTSAASNTCFHLLPNTSTATAPELISELFHVPVGGYVPFVASTTQDVATTSITSTTTSTSSSSSSSNSTSSAWSLGLLARTVVGTQHATSSMANMYTELLNDFITFIKRTYQPSVIKRKRRHGYRARKATPGGRAILKRRLLKGRRHLTPVWGCWQ